MPQSRHRHKHHTHQQTHHQQHHTSAAQSTSISYRKNNTAWFFVIFIGIIGAVVAFFLYKMNWISAVGGAAIGGILGYIIGNFINKASKAK